jgi:hypothetical protein
MTSWGWANVDPRVLIWTNLVDILQKMFHAKYLSCSSYGFSQEDFFKLLFYTYKENEWLLGPGQFYPKGISLSKLGRHPLEDVSCQMSKL